MDAKFRLYNRRTVSGELAWHERAASAKGGQREKAITLTSQYVVKWRQYSHLNGKGGDFQYLLLPVLAAVPLNPPRATDLASEPTRD